MYYDKAEMSDALFQNENQTDVIKTTLKVHLI